MTAKPDCVRVTSPTRQAANDLIKFLTGAIAIPVIKAQGMEPGGG